MSTLISVRLLKVLLQNAAVLGLKGCANGAELLCAMARGTLTPWSADGGRLSPHSTGRPCAEPWGAPSWASQHPASAGPAARAPGLAGRCAWLLPASLFPG